ncbi:RepB family plasmid replication initiator protein [Acinetobacter sp. HY1485]|uniref:RepB family plasmid replication initiator protein n=1 Tax=Acinetobacter sp. HY1485 TaxID=2970918 RepID=UPI0022B9B42F|nr:RepB family plasmid replication initiator protein [Acinetobacter sp. HY1485]
MLKLLGVTLDAAYLAMIEAEDTLFKRQFSILNEDRTWTKSRWIQDANYRKGEGCILVTLTRVVIEHVTKLNGFQEYFTSYYLNQTANLKSVYAVRLYELIIQWKSVGKTPIFLVEKLRDQLGIDCNEYSRMEAFKRHVLDLGIEQINLHSDLNIEYVQQKKGRKIIGFFFKINKEETLRVTQKKLTKKQITVLAKKLSEDRVFGGKFAEIGGVRDEFELRLINELQNSKKLCG